MSLAKLISRLARNGEDLERESGEKKRVERTREEDQCKSVTNPSQVPGMVIRTTLYTSHCTALCKALCKVLVTVHCTVISTRYHKCTQCILYIELFTLLFEVGPGHG